MSKLININVVQTFYLESAEKCLDLSPISLDDAIDSNPVIFDNIILPIHNSDVKIVSKENMVYLNAIWSDGLLNGGRTLIYDLDYSKKYPIWAMDRSGEISPNCSDLNESLDLYELALRSNFEGRSFFGGHGPEAFSGNNGLIYINQVGNIDGNHGNIAVPTSFSQFSGMEFVCCPDHESDPKFIIRLYPIDESCITIWNRYGGHLLARSLPQESED